MTARRTTQGMEGGNALRPRPVQTKPVSEMTQAEYAEWSEDLRAWLFERDEAMTPKVNFDEPEEPHRYDPMNRKQARPMPKTKTHGQKRAERAALIREGL